MARHSSDMARLFRTDRRRGVYLDGHRAAGPSIDLVLRAGRGHQVGKTARRIEISGAGRNPSGKYAND
jgi:hypothetical protein